MLLALRLLYESSAVVHPPAGRSFRGSPPLGRPLFREEGIAFLHGIEVHGSSGQIIPSARARAFLPSKGTRAEIGNLFVRASGNVRLKGISVSTSNRHEVRHSSVVLGANRIEKPDDEDAILAILMSQ